jgi:predicted ATPase
MMAISPRTKEVIAFGPFKLIASERLLERDGVAVDLSARALGILVELLSRPNEVVSKRDLLSRVWPDVTVEEGALRLHILNLRKALGDGKDGARYITTLPGRGYCFVAPVSRPGDQAPENPPLAPSFPQANLPNRPTGMIGRDDDILKLSARINASRFVTIVGSGGVGKTTAAIAVGHHLVDAFAGAVLFVDLSMLSDPGLVATAIASMLGLSVQSSDATPGLIAYLRSKRILLILDTCEHLIEAVAELASRIFVSAPQLHILATSREALQVEHEHVYRLDPLACPPDDPTYTAASAKDFPATRLFMERAEASGARFDFSDAEAAIVVSICRKLDGVALAIELAARRVESFGLRQTADLLDQRLTLLWVGPRTAPPRQKTLHATLDWSYELLSETERAVLRRLAVFVGHFTLDAVLAVVTSVTLDQSLVLGAIDSLVAKSMVATRPVGAMMRYRLLDTTRAYALEMSGNDIETAELAVRHASYYRRWLEQAGTEWSTLTIGMERVPYFANLANVRAALEWCFGASGNTEIGARLAAAATPVFLAMSLLPECYRWSKLAIAALDDADRGGSEEMHLQAGLGISSMFTIGNSEPAHAALTRGLELAEKILNPAAQFRLMGQLHMFHRRAGSFDQMLALAQRGEAAAKENADPVAMAVAHVLLGVSHHLIGNQAEARPHLEAAIAQAPLADPAKARRFGYNYERARIVLARTLWLAGCPDQAVRMVRQTVGELAAADPVTVCIALIWGGCVFRWSGDLPNAEECVERLVPHADRHSLTPYRAVCDGLRGEMLIERGEIETGVDMLRGALATLHAERYELYATGFNSSLAQGLAMVGRHDEALRTIDQAIAQVMRHGELSLPELQRIRGELLEKVADEPGAETAFSRAIELADRQSALSWRLRASTSLARLQLRQGRREEARKGLAETYSRFSEGFDTADLKAAKRLLNEMD